MMCTGHLPTDETTLRLFKNVFSPEIGYSLAFIGFVQPASGGILTMAETQVASPPPVPGLVVV